MGAGSRRSNQSAHSVAVQSRCESPSRAESACGRSFAAVRRFPAVFPARRSVLSAQSATWATSRAERFRPDFPSAAQMTISRGRESQFTATPGLVVRLAQGRSGAAGFRGPVAGRMVEDVGDFSIPATCLEVSSTGVWLYARSPPCRTGGDGTFGAQPHVRTGRRVGSRFWPRTHGGGSSAWPETIRPDGSRGVPSVGAPQYR